MNPIERFLLFVAAPAVVILSLVEACVLARRGGYDWRGMGVSFFDFVLRIAVTLWLPLSIATPLIVWVRQNQLSPIALDGWAAGIGLFLGVEFFYYWLHRASHRVRWFWANHAVHHSPNQLNLAASLRIGAFGRLSGNIVFLLPLAWLGFDLRTIAAAVTLNLLYQFWLHATWIPKLGWLEYVLNTPSAHRVHHASNVEYLDGNYGGVLIVFDRLFGTYIEERDDLPCRYGWVHPLQGFNPLKTEFYQWWTLLRDIAGARSLGEAVGYLWRPPGWRPDGRSETTEDLRACAALGSTAQAPRDTVSPGSPA